MRRLAVVLVLSAAAVLAGCGDKATGPSPASVAGTWNLQSVNGTQLPFIVIQVGNDKVEITSDVITASSNGTFTQLTTIQTTQSGQVTTDHATDSGTWSLSGTAVNFVFESNGSTGTGTLSGNTLTVATSGLSLVYRKQ